MRWIFLLFSLVTDGFARDYGLFSGRVSRLNTEAKLVRLRVDFHNVRFLNQDDEVQLWLEHSPGQRCISHLKGKSNQYLLLKLQDLSQCLQSVPLSVGNYLRLYSPNLEQNIDVARELVEVLIKKRLAAESALSRARQELNSFGEKKQAIDQKYTVLKQKLESEWQDKLQSLGEEKTQQLRTLNHMKERLGEIDFKLEKFRIEESNLKTDQWSLDPTLYFKK